MEGMFLIKTLNTVLEEELIQEHVSKWYKKIKCPVCSNETSDDYFICPHCGWEYDNIVDENIYSTTNKSTIKDYRKTFK